MARRQQVRPEPAPITSDGGAPVLGPDAALAYSMHRTSGLAGRLEILDEITDEAALVGAAARLMADGCPGLAGEVDGRLAEVRRARADAAQVVEEPRGMVLGREIRSLLCDLAPEDRAEARTMAVTAAQLVADAERAERLRAAEARERIATLRGAAVEAQRIAYTGQAPRDVGVEEVVLGREVVYRRLDTGEIIDTRPATDWEIDRAAQLALWGET